MATVTVEEVGKGQPLRLFLELPVALGDLPPGTAWLQAAQRRRLRPGCPPGPGSDAVMLLARRAGRPVGRLTAHFSDPGDEARFGFMIVERPEDADVAAALLGGAARWASARGRTELVGPMSWGPQDEAGVLVAGHDEPVVTGRAWTPAWYADLLEGCGLAPLETSHSYRLPAGALGQAALDPDENAVDRGAHPAPGLAAGGAGTDVVDGGLCPSSELAVPAELAPYADPQLVLAGPGGMAIVAVPDVAGGMADGGNGRSMARGAWSLARRARKRAWQGCVVLALDGPEEALIPILCAIAGRAGYDWVLSPWASPGTDPVMTHRLYAGSAADLA